MKDIRGTVQKRLSFFCLNVFLCVIVFVSYFNKSLLPTFVEYGEYQSENILSRIVNIAIDEQLDDGLIEKIILQNSDKGMIIDLNTAILNSVACNIVNRSQQILYSLESGVLDEDLLESINLGISEIVLKNGMIYEIPTSMVFGNALIGSLGAKIPVKYKVVGKIKGSLISSVSEYGINNALLEISLQINAESKVLIPMMTSEKKVEVKVPLIVEIIQGEVPDYYLGTQVIGGSE
jgi:sporulation protein YunB